MSSKTKIKEYLKTKKQIVEQALEKYISPVAAPFDDHLKAVHYSLFVGGKRIRPILCLAAGELVSNDPDIEKNFYL